MSFTRVCGSIHFSIFTNNHTDMGKFVTNSIETPFFKFILGSIDNVQD